MAAAGVDEDITIQAARILLTLRNRRLSRYPEWVQNPCLPEIWPKKKRSRQRLPGGWRKAEASALPKLGLASSLAGSVPSSSGEGMDRSPAPQHRCREIPSRDGLMAAAVPWPDSPRPCGAPAGSGPSTSANRTRYATVVVNAAAKASDTPVSASVKGPMKAASPETPLEFTKAAGSGASSSGDDAVSPPGKRSADEGCSSPAKRPRVSAGDGGKAIPEPKMQQQTPEDKAVKHGFDLNMLPEDDEGSGFC